MMVQEPVNRSGMIDETVENKKELELREVFSHLRDQHEGKATQPDPALRKSPCLSPRRSKRNGRERRRPSYHHHSQTSLETSSSGQLQKFLSDHPSSTTAASSKTGRRSDLSRVSRDTESRSGDAEDEATITSTNKKRRKAERDKLKQKTKEKTRRERSKRDVNKALPETQQQTEKDNGPSTSGNDSSKSLNQRRETRVMLRQPSQMVLADVEKDPSESSSYSLDLSHADLAASSCLGNISFRAEVEEEDDDDDENAGTVLQFDPTSTGNVFSVKQFYHSESECEVNNTDGSQSIVSISEMQDPMLEAQQHRPSNQPIFDFLDEDGTNNQNILSWPPSPNLKSPRSHESEAQKKPRKKLSRDNMLVGDAESYTHFFDPENAPTSPRRKKVSQNPNSSWPPPGSKRATIKAPPKRKGKKKSTKSKAQSEEGETNNSGTCDDHGAADRPKRKVKKAKSKKSKEPSSPKKKSSSPAKSDGEQDLRRKTVEGTPSTASRPKFTKSHSLSQLEVKNCKPSEDEKVSSSIHDNNLHNTNDNNLQKKHTFSSVVDEKKTSINTLSSTNSSTKEKISTKAETASELNTSDLFDPEEDERRTPGGRNGSRRSVGLASSIGRYFTRGRTNPTSHTTDAECTDNEDGSSVQSSSSRPSLFARSRRNRHQLLDVGDSSIRSLDTTSINVS